MEEGERRGRKEGVKRVEGGRHTEEWCREGKGREGGDPRSNRWQVRELTAGKVRMAESVNHNQNNGKKKTHTTHTNIIKKKS